MQKVFRLGSFWKWYESGKEDFADYHESDIVQMINAPLLVPGGIREGIVFEVPELAFQWTK